LLILNCFVLLVLCVLCVLVLLLLNLCSSQFVLSGHVCAGGVGGWSVGTTCWVAFGV